MASIAGKCPKCLQSGAFDLDHAIVPKSTANSKQGDVLHAWRCRNCGCLVECDRWGAVQSGMESGRYVSFGVLNEKKGEK